MARKDKGHFGAKHPGASVRKEVAELLKMKETDGAMPCPLAFQAAVELSLTPAEIGQAIDLLEIPISRCQLGLFGYSPVSRILQPAESVPEDLEAAIRTALSDGRLPCADAFRIARDFKLAKIRVSSACEKLRIKISACQLGAF
ncbi:MAG: hypothetical protein A4E67_01575 [Syntrophaceae bacterium PtaB.Bin038]|jgi:hypothetical protein|nr:MAG: hypothetical protein A4E67_01575 [Syntrophaceae bacterium PtaB.Bin038]